ncbi:MAG: nitrile hydratase subunit beta [Betaproteobacteria bacterium]|nr:nitrile hydratase subunit beta [Betaproteobacteria bacterium]
MNGVHDMGGMQGFGPVRPEPNEPLFHAPWERQALAMTVAMGACGQWNIDISRSARESLPPAQYLSSSYYAIWLAGLEKLMLARGMVSAAELHAGKAEDPPLAGVRALDGAQTARALAQGSASSRAIDVPPRFVVGQRVRARQIHPASHTRLPRYVRGHTGTVERIHGAHVFPDTRVSRPVPPFVDEAHWLYTVVFDGHDLWGSSASAGLLVSVDAWEPYLQAVEGAP